MIDCGFGLKESVRRLDCLGLQPEQIDGIFVTHEHQDHISGVESLAAKYGLDVYMTEGTAKVWKSRGRVEPILIRADEQVVIKSISVRPIAVPHDAREPVQFVFSRDQLKVGILTDLGSLTPHIYDAFSGCQMLLIEANHDLKMLQQGSYPMSLKKRVAGNWGHLNNMQTAEFVSRINLNNCLKKLIIGHISEKNNRVELAAQALDLYGIDVESRWFASQDSPLDWVQLSE